MEKADWRKKSAALKIQTYFLRQRTPSLVISTSKSG